MESLSVERLDHHGLVSGIVDELKLVEIIDNRIVADEQNEISMGEAVKGMILNGLGFSNRPLMLTPQFYNNLPVELLFREGVKAAHFNRHKLGRTLDAVHEYGCDILFSEIALSACQQEGVDVQNNSLDSTSFSLTGQYNTTEDDDEQAITITYGHSKDHRPDLKQAVQELLVSQDGGIPLYCKSHDGNASDTIIFQERSKALIDEFKKSTLPRKLIADSKLYNKKGAEFLKQLPFITRIPGTLALEQSLIQETLATPERWQELAPGYRYHSVKHTHYDIKQRWLVIYSDAAYRRADKKITKALEKERQRLDKAVFHLKAQRYGCLADAQRVLKDLQKTARYHVSGGQEFIEHKRYSGKGRPKNNTDSQDKQWQIIATFVTDDDRVESDRQQKACFIIGTNLPELELDDRAIFQAYKNQSKVESGFRFLKDPLFFVSSLFLKKPSRIQALLMVMTLSLLVYSIAERRMRKKLAASNESLPNQINIPTKTPTLRWVFQILEGINRVTVILDDKPQCLIDGMNDLRTKIIRLFGEYVCRIYQISCA